MPPIPLDRSKGLVTFGQLHTLAKEFKVDRKVCRLFIDNGRDIIKVVKPIITKYATDSSGNFSTNWKLMSSTQRASLWILDMRGRCMQYNKKRTTEGRLDWVGYRVLYKDVGFDMGQLWGMVWEEDAQWQPQLPRPSIDLVDFYYFPRRWPSVASVDEDMMPVTLEDVDGNETGELSGWRDPSQYATPPQGGGEVILESCAESDASDPSSRVPDAQRQPSDEDRRYFEGSNAELIIREERHEAYLLEHLQRHHGRMPEPQGDFDVFAGIRAALPSFLP
ncbi:hypothetical protein V8E54_004662 [Elaphomyces granulatus]